ncbi:MAG: prepilin peptidase [Planctomycetota bacterium]
MASHEWIQLGFLVAQGLWVFAFGACVGSLINVLVYRLPLGLSVITPPSACPHCGVRLSWRDNIPVLGWLLLKGRCRYCRTPISIEYPLVEFVGGLLFVLLYVVLYTLPPGSEWLGVHWGAMRPEWALSGFARSWPELVVILVLFGSLLAMTLVDAKTFTIPLVLAWVPAVLALVAYPLHAAIVGETPFARGWRPPAHDWSIPIPSDTTTTGVWWIGAAIGGTIGIALSNGLLALGVLKHSFADYEDWERAELARRAEAGDGEATPDAEMWIEYPHARREMLREILFLSPALALAAVGGLITLRMAGPWELDPTTLTTVASWDGAPLWVRVLSGTLMGLLIGGGVIWAVRIFGSLAFGREAMGLGDVHLLAAVGACLGWIDSVLTLFAACFVGAFIGIGAKLLLGSKARALPFGPYLAIAAMLIFLGKPLVEIGLTRLMHAETPVNLP